MKQIRTLLEQLDTKVYTGPEEVAITKMTADSRKVEPGTLFICLDGAHVDGHDFIDQALEKGAVALLVSHAVDVPEHVGVIEVPNTREAMQTLVPFFLDYPAQKMRMIGVTGTNGKTTTTHMIAHILKEQGYKVGIIGTVHVVIGDEVYPVHNTTPDVVDLQDFLDMMVKAGVTHCIMEVSSHALAMNRVAGVEYDTAVFTNLTQDHLDYHKTLENYLAAKCLLFKNLTAGLQMKVGKGAVVNCDDPSGEKVESCCEVPVITYGTKGQGVLQATDICVDTKSSTFTVHYKQEAHCLKIKTTGLFNVYNTLAAIGTCLNEGLSLGTILKALGSFEAVPGRFELIEEGQDFAVIVDYAHTPDGLENILQTARTITKQRVLVVFGCGGDRDATKRPIMGGIAAKYGDLVFVTSDNPRTEDPTSIVDQVAEGVYEEKKEGLEVHVIVDRKTAIFEAVKAAKTGDVVIIAGKGHENYQILKDKTIHFDDREVAREALKER